MSIVINQPAMLGDLLFIEPIIRLLSEKDTVVWPVKDQYYWIKDYIKYPTIVKQSEFSMDYELCEMKPNYYPLRFAMPLMHGLAPHADAHHDKTMLDKYRLLNLPLDMWRTLTWERNHAKEDHLYHLLGLDNVKEYTLVNMFFKDIYEVQPEMRSMQWENPVFMKPIEGFTMLDWTKVILNASEIHTVETALLYMIEVLPVEAPMHLYCRWPYDGSLNGVKEFISDKWIRHTK